METTAINIEPRLYTIEKAAKLLGTDHTRSKFYEIHVLRGGLKLTRINGKVRVSSIELARYIQAHTAPEQ
jgi:hypothetical protein